MKRLFIIDEFRGLLERIAPRERKKGYASVARNVDISTEVGKLKAAKGFEDLGLTLDTTTGLRFIEFDNPVHGVNVKLLLLQKSNTEMSFWLDTGGGYGTRQDVSIYKKTQYYPEETEITLLDDVSYVIKNGVVYGGVGIGEQNYSFIFKLLDYKRFGNNAGYNSEPTSYRDDFSLDGSEDAEDAYLLEASDLAPPNSNNVSLGSLTASADGVYSVLGVSDFDDGTWAIYATFVYDGFQESPFQKHSFGDLPLALASVETSSNNKIYFNLRIQKNLISDRVTGINIYLQKVQPRASRTDIRFIKFIPFTDTRNYLRRDDVTLTFDSSGDISQWADTNILGVTWLEFQSFESGSGTSVINIAGDDFNNAVSYQSRQNYVITQDLFPKYKYNHIFNDRMFVAPVAYNQFNDADSDFEYYSNMCVYSPTGGDFSLLPFTNRLLVNETITGINSLSDFLVLFTKQAAYIYNASLALKDKKGGFGSVSHFSIIQYSNYLYYAGKGGFIKFDGFNGVKFSNYFVETSYNNLTESQKETLTGVYDSLNEKLIWVTRNADITFIYSLKTNDWVVRDYQLNHIAQSTFLTILGCNGTDIFQIDSGYDYDSSSYNCRYQVDQIDLGQPNIVKSLTLCYVKYKSNDSITLKFLHLGTVIDTITLLSTEGEVKIEQFDISGNAESFDIRIDVTPSDEWEIDYIDVWGEVHDIKGMES